MAPPTQPFTNKSLAKPPTDETPPGGNKVRHVTSISGFCVSDSANDNHPVEKFAISRFQQLIDRIVGQARSLALAHDFQKFMIELRIDLTDPRRAWEVG